MERLKSIMECMSNDIKPPWDDIIWLIKQTEKLNDCENLLSEAHDLMDDVHCYDTDLYHEISKYFEGKKSLTQE